MIRRPMIRRPMTGRPAWLGTSRLGLLAVAVLVGVGSGLGAVAFRYLITVCTWLPTGHAQFGQAGHVGSAHLPWLGLGFFVLIPAVGGLIYGPLIYRWAREARGHGVPEVMIAVAERGGRIRPQVSVVKALASALCIGTGGSVGREGPIVQIGSALASSLGQWVRMPENRMRILVACGAGGGIAATFNAPITGVFFGAEIILREFSVDALFSVMLSATIADAVAIPLLGNHPFLSGFPTALALPHARDYLLVALLAVIAGLVGLLFKTMVYGTEDLCDRLWRRRPEWARPAVGGLVLGLILLAVPQLYGVGYPVMDRAVGGGYALWFLLVLAAGKILACSVTLGIGGSGGVFAPSLFVGATSGMAFGELAGHLFGASAGPPALYAVVAMGAVFASAARAPLTALASVVELTGDFTLTLPVMLAVAVATATSRALSYGTLYTTKLLRRGYDIDGPAEAVLSEAAATVAGMTTLRDRPSTALLVIDVQNGVVGGAYLRDEVVANISRLVARARQEGVPVVWVQHSADDELISGSEDWQIVPELSPAGGEPVIAKRYGDAFEDTGLEDVLAGLGTGRLVVTGAETDACIRSTLHGAFTRGYDTTLVSDAHTAGDKTSWGAPPVDQVIAHTNLYWSFQAAPGRTAGTAETAKVDFSGPS